MHIGIIEPILIEAKQLAAEPQIALLEEIHVAVLVNKSPYPDVELPAINQIRLLDVFLDDVGLLWLFSWVHTIVNQVEWKLLLEKLEFIEQLDACASIFVSRLEYPDGWLRFLIAL